MMLKGQGVPIQKVDNKSRFELLSRNCRSGSRNHSRRSCRGTRFRHLTSWESRCLVGILTQPHILRKPQRLRAVCQSCCFQRGLSRSVVLIRVILTRFASIATSQLRTVSIELCRSITKTFFATGRFKFRASCGRHSSNLSRARFRDATPMFIGKTDRVDNVTSPYHSLSARLLSISDFETELFIRNAGL